MILFFGSLIRYDKCNSSRSHNDKETLKLQVISVIRNPLCVTTIPASIHVESLIYVKEIWFYFIMITKFAKLDITINSLMTQLLK